MKQIKKAALGNTFATMLLLVIFAFLSYDRFHAAEIRENSANLERCIRTFRELLSHKGEGFNIVDGKLLTGTYVINGNFEVPDKIREIFGGTATVFMGDRRISTNVLRDDGIRAVGTRLEGPAYDAVFGRGETFRGETKILGIPYFTAYDPIRNSKGEIIGALYVGLKKSEFLAHRSTLKVQMSLLLFGLSSIFIIFIILLNRFVNRAEEELIDSKQHLSDIIQFLPDATMVINDKGKITAWNRAMEELAGVKAEDMLGKGNYEYALPFYDERRPTLIDLVLQADKEIEAKYARIERNGNKLIGESYIHGKSGTSVYVHGTAAALRNSRGEIIGAIESIRDISERKQMEDRLRALSLGIEQSPACIVITDREGCIEYVNPKFTQLTGYTLAEAIGQNPRILKSGLTGPEVHRQLWETILDGGEWHGEFCNKKKNGDLYWEFASISPIVDTKGGIYRFIAVKEDITEKKNFEKKLAEREIFLSSILDSIQDGITVLDRELRIVRLNSVLEKDFSGRMPFVGRKCHEIYFGAAQPCDNCPSLKTISSGKASSMIFPVPETDNAVWLELFAFPLFDANKESVTGVIEVARNISERILAEKALSEKETQLRTITSTAQDAIMMVDTAGMISFWNPAAETIFGYSSDETLGMELHSLIAPQSYREAYRQGFAHFRETGQGAAIGKTLELEAVRKGGEEFPVELSLSAIQIRDSWQAVGVLRDITARRMVETEMRLHGELVGRLNSALAVLASDKRIYCDAIDVAFRTITESSARAIEAARASIWFYSEGNSGIRCIDLYESDSDRHSQGTLLEANDYPAYFCELQKESCIVADDAVVDPRTREFADSYLHPLGITSMLDVPIRNADRVIGVVCLEHIGKPRNWKIEEQSYAMAISGFISIVIETSERKKAEGKVKEMNTQLEQTVAERTSQLVAAQEELVRKEKLAILGQLSGSVGHELRNPLGVMSNAVYFLKMVHADSDEKTREYLDIIKHEIDNSQRIITDLLDFARTKKPQTGVISVHELLHKSLGNCVIPATVNLQTEIPDSLPLLKIDPLQLEQVFQNLIINAVQAMPNGGTLRIAANPGLNMQNSRPEGECIEISLTDTGEGILPENMNKLFQPLYTTKAKGIGLGLVVCRNLVEANGGSIGVKSLPGEGTTFTVIMPVKGE